MTSTWEALMTFKDIINSSKECLRKILIQGDFSEYRDDRNMHSTARLADILSKFSDNLQAQPQTVTEFLMDEIKVLEECKRIGLPNFIPRSAFLAILSERVDGIHTKPVEFIREVWDYVKVVLSSVLNKYSENFPQIQPSIRKAGRKLISKIKEESVSRVMEIVEMEKLTDYTCNPEYMTDYTQKIAAQGSFITAVQNNHSSCQLTEYGFGNVMISHLWNYDAHLLRQAFGVKVRITAYWTIVVRRIVDSLALYFHFSVKNLVNSQLQEIVKEFVNTKGGGEVERMLEELPSVKSKREKLMNSIKLLKESKDAVDAIVSDFGDR